MTEITVTTKTNLGPLIKGIRVSQRFKADKDDLNGISLWIATYCRKIDSTAKLTILDSDCRNIIRKVELNTNNFTDNTWQLFCFENIPASKGETFWFSFETMGKNQEEAITLWTNNKISGKCHKNMEQLKEVICFKCHYGENLAKIFDPLLFKNNNDISEFPLNRRNELQKIIHFCIFTKDLHFLRLAHLTDAFGKVNDVKNILSIGCGKGYHEAFLAGRFLDIRVKATDLFPFCDSFPFNNFEFCQMDILAPNDNEKFDFVLSIECLEHIKDYRLAFRNMASKVKPGKFLYLSVPFASEEEQRNEELVKQEWDNHQHYIPGFTYRDLDTLFGENEFEIVHIGSMFNPIIINNINSLLNKMDFMTIERGLGEIARLFLLDISNKKAVDRKDALGICILGKKKNGC